MQATASQQAKETRTLPAPDTFVVKGRMFEIYRFEAGEGPALEEAVTTYGDRMLTRTKAKEIIDNPELNAEFKKHLNPGDWTYVRDMRGRAAVLSHSSEDRELRFGAWGWTKDTSPVVVLEVTKPSEVKNTSAMEKFEAAQKKLETHRKLVKADEKELAAARKEVNTEIRALRRKLGNA